MASTSVTLVGNLTNDPELKFAANGSARLSFSIACSDSWTDQSGERQEKTSFFDVTVWRALGEHLAEILEKGVKVIVVGKVEQRSWEADDGTKRSKVEVVGYDVGIHGYSVNSFERRRRDDNGNGNGHERRPANTRRPTGQRQVPAQPAWDDEDTF